MNDTPSRALAKRLRDVADAARAMAAVAVPKESNVHIGWGVVESVNDTPPSVDVTPGNNADGVSKWSKVSILGWYVPTVGDNVLVLFDGTDRIVLGVMGDEGAGLQSPVGYSILGPVPVQTFPGLFIPGGLTYVVGAKGYVSTGSVDMTVKVNGSNVPGLDPVSLNTSPTPFTCTPYRIPNLTELNAESSSESGTGDMAFTILTVTA